MKDLSSKLLTNQDKAQIIEAVQQVEKKTSGEIVPLVVASSDTYPLSNTIGGFTMAMVLSICATQLLGTENMWVFLAILMGAFIVFHEIVKRALPLKRLFISDQEIDEEVEESAISAFYRNGLYKTKNETGVLVYISVFEHRVWVLADRGINEKVNPETWQEVVDMITIGIKKKTTGESIVKAIHRIGEILEAHFPVKPDDANELKNLIVGE